MVGSTPHSHPPPGATGAKRTREEDGGEEEGSEREKYARREEAPGAENIAEDPTESGDGA